MERVGGGVHGAVLAPFALGGGLLLSVAFAPLAQWWAVFLAVVVLNVTVQEAARARVAVLLGALFGAGLLVPGVAWQLLLTPEAYVGNIVAELPFYAALGLGLFVVRAWPWSPVWTAGVWTLAESAFSTIPFGGFPWFRLGHALIDSPLAILLPVIGTGGLTFVVALLGGAATRGVFCRCYGMTAWLLVVVLLSTASASLVPPATSLGTADVGWVQGGVREEGIYGIGEPRTTTYAHAAAVDALMDRVDAGELPRPDFVVAPENTTDMDPDYDATTRALVAGMVARAGAPVLVGTPLVGPREDTRRTTAIWWTPQGPGASYDKQHLVPMGEWIPFRDFFLPLVPALQYVGAQTLPGTGPGVLPVTLPDGRPTSIGVAICYDVAFAEAFRAQVDAGAQVLVVQSNNAMFAGSPQLRQQFDITRVRAAEVGRPILVVTVSGTSGLIDAHGRTVFEAPAGVGASGVERLDLLEGRTPFVAGGWLVEPVVAWGTLLGLIGVFVGARSRGMRKNGPTPANVAARTES